jgi:hypothetical protein
VSLKAKKRLWNSWSRQGIYMCVCTLIYVEGKERESTCMENKEKKRERKRRASVFSHHLRLVVLRYTAADAVSLSAL